jgi:hypothetical protein
LRKLPTEWVQEWQNLYARRFEMHINAGEGFRLLEIFIFVSLSLRQFYLIGNKRNSIKKAQIRP